MKEYHSMCPQSPALWGLIITGKTLVCSLSPGGLLGYAQIGLPSCLSSTEARGHYNDMCIVIFPSSITCIVIISDLSSSIITDNMADKNAMEDGHFEAIDGDSDEMTIFVSSGLRLMLLISEDGEGKSKGNVSLNCSETAISSSDHPVPIVATEVAPSAVAVSADSSETTKPAKSILRNLLVLTEPDSNQ